MEELEVAYIAGIFDGEGSVDYTQRIEKKVMQKGISMAFLEQIKTKKEYNQLVIYLEIP